MSELNQFNALHGISIPQLLARRAAEHPFRLALSARSHRGFRDRLSYAQLASRMDAVARGLAQKGLKAGERVALFLNNDAVREGVLTALGCWRLGAIVSPINVRGSDDELVYALGLVEPRFIVCTRNDVARVARLCPDVARLVVGAPARNRDVWPEPEQVFSYEPLPEFPDADTTSVLLFTSGTTARSKAVMHCHRSQIFCGFSIASGIGLTAQDGYQGAWPLYTSSVLNMACMAAWVAGASVTLEETTLDNAGRLRLIESEATTVYHGVTSPLHFMIDEFAHGDYDLSRVRRVVYGGAAMPVEVITKFRERMPWADQIHIWGMTETGPSGTYLAPWFLPRKAGCIGQPMTGCAVSIVDEDMNPLPAGSDGEIVFSGPSAAQGYWRNPEATRVTFVGGWVRTGDIGRFDEEGHLHFVDRKKDIINRGGLKISSAAVEEVIYQFPGVSEVAVVAVPHAGLGEDIAACVVAVEGAALQAEALREFCARRLADYETPRKWHFLTALPKNPMGKILKRELREQLVTQ